MPNITVNGKSEVVFNSETLHVRS